MFFTILCHLIMSCSIVLMFFEQNIELLTHMRQWQNFTKLWGDDYCTKHDFLLVDIFYLLYVSIMSYIYLRSWSRGILACHESLWHHCLLELVICWWKYIQCLHWPSFINISCHDVIWCIEPNCKIVLNYILNLTRVDFHD